MATFSIEADSSMGNPTVEVLSPTRESLPVQIKQTIHGAYTAGFTPKDVGGYSKKRLNLKIYSWILWVNVNYFYTGDHSVEVKLGGSHVEGSPFLVKAYNADKVKVTDINSGVVGKPVFFSSTFFIE